MQPAEHEVADARAAVLLEPRHNVDEHQPGDPLRPGPVCDQDAGQPAHAGPDQDHRPADGVEHGHHVGGQRLDVVVGVRCAVAVAMTPAVQRDDVEAVIGQDLAGVLPGVPVLAPAVQHQDAGAIGGRIGVAGRGRAIRLRPG